jgi:signal transduction histidine kinase
MNVPAPPRTLVIDDDPILRRVLCNYLLRLGHVFLEAKDGREGLGLFRSEHPDLVLVDLLMPVMDGMEFLGIATRENPAMPVIVVSGAGGIDDVIRALRIGAWDYVTKPIGDLSVFEHTINKSLERARLLKEKARYQEFLEGEVKRRTLELELINKELERTQQHLWEQLEQAQKMESVGMLAGGIAHDFNNILASIFFSAEMVMEGLPRDRPEYADLERIIRVSRRGKSLVRRILSFTSTRSKSYALFQVAAVVEESVQFLRAVLPSNIELSVDIDPESGTIEGDPVQIQQIVMNLITNAVHALRGTPNPRLSVRVGRSRESGGQQGPDSGTPGWIEISVKDNGHGIRQEDKERIFTPRFTTKGEAEGSGLGLFLVEELVSRHKGEIRVESEPGKGAEFTVVLPLSRHLPQEVRKEAFRGAPQGGENILVADDDLDLSESLRLMLTGLGYTVVLTRDGQEALERLESMPGAIHLAILDQDMPRLSGTTVCRKLLEVVPGLPVLLLTGRMEESIDALMHPSNVREVLFKPVSKGRIAASIRSILDAGESRRDAPPCQEDEQ